MADRFGLSLAEVESLLIWQYSALIDEINGNTKKTTPEGMTPVMG